MTLRFVDEPGRAVLALVVPCSGRRRARRHRVRSGRAPGGGEEGRQGRLVHLAGAAQRGEGRQAVRGRVSRHQGRGAPHRARSASSQRVMQELQANIKNVDVVHTSDAGHFVFLKEQEAPDQVHAGRRGRVPGRLQGQGRLLLRPARHRERHRLQHQGRPGGRGAQDLEGPARPQVEGQDGHRASRATAASSPRTCWRW